MNHRDAEDAEEVLKRRFLRSERSEQSAPPAIQQRLGRKRSVSSAGSVSLRFKLP